MYIYFYVISSEIHFLLQGSREQANKRCSVGPAMGRATWPCSDNQILPEDIRGRQTDFAVGWW
jgi:hypothetical protein